MAKKAKTGVTIQDRLLASIDKVDRPGTFCTGGDLPLVMPGLDVDGLGPIRLPLGKTQARKLIKLCRQAPYGKGTETVVDTDVRRVWELDPEQFRCTNPKWDETLPIITHGLQTELGLEDRKLAAHLYKLLLYEKGSFFLPHRDGEKLDRMVATLVIGLPSVHEGGELIVSHEGSQHEFTFSGAASGHELSYAAFYADCEHEVRPVRSGYRLCLVYNVTLARSRGKRGVTAPTSSTAIDELHGVLDAWRRQPNEEKLAVTLEHQYTQDGLRLDTLKGVDRARAEVLFAAAEAADCVAHLALVTLWQSGSAEYSGPVYSRRRGWYDDYEDDDGGDGSDYVMGVVFDESLSVNHWSDRDGNKVALGKMRLDEGEIVSPGPLDEWEPDDEDFEGYTGNAGMTLERWYHRAGVVIWPREKHFSVLCSAGTDASVGGLHALVKQLKRAPKSRRDQQRKGCCEFAAAIIESWQPSFRRYAWNRSGSEGDRSTLLADLVKAMVAVDAAQPLSRLIDHALDRRDKYDLTDTQLAAIFSLKSWLLGRKSKTHPAVSGWLTKCRTDLEAIVANPPQRPTDFRRPAKLSCKCSDCRELSKFLGDPNEEVRRFPMAKERRRHLHQIIDGNRCDLTHVTERRGRPYTLVCKKTTASYEAACKTHQRDEANLRVLQSLEQKLG